MKKEKYNIFTTEGDINRILQQKFPELKCPSCGYNGIYAGSIETQFDNKIEENIVLSFNVFCSKCGSVFDKWDNTNRSYWLTNR